MRDISGIENWTFDEADSNSYLLKYNPQFYVDKNKLPSKKVIYDIIYVGSDRHGTLEDRRKIISDLYQHFVEMGLKLRICLLSNSPEVDERIRISKAMNSTEYNGLIAQGRALLDIVEKKEQWSTLRPLLALSNGKKVITNNLSIKKEKYYSADNIFIIEEDDLSDLIEFVRSPFSPIEPNIMEYYECRAWVNRFKKE